MIILQSLLKRKIWTSRIIPTLMLICLFSQYAAFPAKANQATGRPDKNAALSPSAQGPAFIFLPFVVCRAPSSPPFMELFQPRDDEVVNTLIPHYVFAIGASNIPQGFFLPVGGVGETPQPNWNMGIPGGYDPSKYNLYDFIPDENLLPGHHYYWRIGLFAATQPYRIWTADQSFNTTTSRGEILPQPKLVSPADKSTVSLSGPGSTVFSWDSVPNAVEYRIYVSSRFQAGVIYQRVNTNTIDLKDSLIGLAPNQTYQWTITARNDYAWGNTSATFSFYLTY